MKAHLMMGSMARLTLSITATLVTLLSTLARAAEQLDLPKQLNPISSNNNCAQGQLYSPRGAESPGSGVGKVRAIPLPTFTSVGTGCTSNHPT